MKISKPVYTLAINMASTNISKTTPTQISAAVGFAPSMVQAYNGAAVPIVLYAGKTGTALIPFTIPPGASVPVAMDQQIGANDVLKALALGAADLSAGWLVLNFFG